ncbi:DsbC family protein [Candidatus Parcubacteria bacterium]|nr:MAG: DsbC family protein [Candidatus Parcubacteria bacterium]
MNLKASLVAVMTAMMLGTACAQEQSLVEQLSAKQKSHHVEARTLTFEVGKGVPSDFLKRLVQTYPSTKFKSVKTTPVAGVYEIQAGKNVVYMASDAQHAFLGHLVNLPKRKDYTEPLLRDLRAQKVDLSVLPMDKAIKVVKGNGERTLYVFTDPDCPFCHRLEQSLDKISNVTIHYFMYPLAQLHPNAPAKANKIYCAKDPASAIKTVILKRGDLPSGEVKPKCEAPLKEIAKVAQALGVNGTPTLIFEDGVLQSGFMPAQMLEKYLEMAHKKKMAEVKDGKSKG